MLFGGTFIIDGWGLVVWSRKSYSGPDEIAYFPGVILAEAISMARSGILHQLEISTKFLRAVVVLHFCPLEIYKNLSLPLSSITYIHYEISFLWKYSFKVFYIQIWFKWEASLLFWSLRLEGEETLKYRCVCQPSCGKV